MPRIKVVALAELAEAVERRRDLIAHARAKAPDAIGERQEAFALMGRYLSKS